MVASRPQAPYLITHQSGKGVIARYHLDTAEIARQVTAFKTAGADGISLSLWLMKNAKDLGTSDLYLDWANGQLSDQCRSNLLSLLAWIRVSGFHFVQVAVEFYNENDPRLNPFSEQLYSENWIFLDWLRHVLDETGIPYLLDPCPEVNDVYKTNPGLQSYAKLLWVDCTATASPDGVPCWVYSFSFIPSNLDVLPDVFQGNPPAILVPHIYRGEQQAVFDGLESIGFGGKPWLVGECFSLTQAIDQPVADAFRQFVVNSKQPILRVCPWPIDPRTPAADANGQPISIDTVPQIVSQPWANAGF